MWIAEETNPPLKTADVSVILEAVLKVRVLELCVILIPPHQWVNIKKAVIG